MQCHQTQRSGRALTLLVCVSRGWKPGRGGGNRWLWHRIWSPASTRCTCFLCTTQAGVHQGDKTPSKNQFPVVQKFVVTKSRPFAPSFLPQYTSGPLPIFSVITADVFMESPSHSSHFHFPLSLTSTVMWREELVNIGRRDDCQGGIHFSCRWEGRVKPRPQVRLTDWPEMRSVPCTEVTGERMWDGQKYHWSQHT